jgi:hypothetical protein
MSWLFGSPEGLAFVVVALTLFIDHMVRKESRVAKFSKKNPNVNFILLFAACAFNILTGYFNHLDSDNTKQVEETYRIERDQKEDGFKQQQIKREAVYRKETEDRVAEFNRQIAFVKDELKAGNAENAEHNRILMIIATNPTPSSAISDSLIATKERYRVAEAGIVDLEAWTAELDNKKDLFLLKQKQDENECYKNCVEALKPSYVVWEYAFSKFSATIHQLAQTYNLKFETDCLVLPTYDKLMKNISFRPDSIIHWCKFPFGSWLISNKNPWTCNFCIRFTTYDNQLFRYSVGNVINERNGPPILIINCGRNPDVNKLLISANDVWLSLPDAAPIREVLTTNNYQTVIDNNLRLFIAQQARELGITK